MTTQTQLIAGTDLIAVATKDYDAAARAELESRGVEFKADTLDSGVCHQAFFTDPDGNALPIHHRYAPPEAAPSSAQTT
ncbi:MAG TPA: hypothetical protein VF729_02020 [Solirubrobacterales bacterium]